MARRARRGYAKGYASSRLRGRIRRKAPGRMHMSIDVRLELRSLSRIAAVAAVACACFGSLAARAQEPSNAAVGFAREIILAKGVTTMTDPIVHGVIETVKNSFLPTNPNLSKELNEEAVVLHKEYDAKKNEVVDAMARAYARHFTEQELKDL